MKTLLATTAVAMTLWIAPTFAQTSSPIPATSVQLPGQVDLNKLIGRSVVNPQNETIGEIESVIADADGKARSVIVAVGGFLGLGERHVAIAWNSMSLSSDGAKPMVAMTKDQLKALPPYRYAETTQRRAVFVERGGVSSVTSMPLATVAGASGPVSVSELMGLNIRNAANETIGDVKDVVLSPDGKVLEVIVGVGGFLGMGERYVAIAWDQLRMSRSGDNGIVANVSVTSDQLKAMPAYKRERNLWSHS